MYNTLMSKTIASVIAQLLVVALPLIGVTVLPEQVTTFVQTGVIIIGGIIIWVERVRRGDVNILGVRK